jgi:Ribbon-helix-helix protein, copG family
VGRALPRKLITRRDGGSSAQMSFYTTATGGTIQTMDKTTLYLPDDLKAAVKRAAARKQISEAEVIRQSIRQTVGAVRPRPRGALFSSGHPIARRTDELLSGFGER